MMWSRPLHRTEPLQRALSQFEEQSNCFLSF
jgi:hypothetical protein